MLNIKDIKGATFKKEFKINRCRFGYHNKNNNGGNFGLDFYKEDKFNQKTDFTLNGAYNSAGELLRLDIMSIRIGEFIYKIPMELINGLDELNGFIARFYGGRL